jgi:hypothetical protein
MRGFLVTHLQEIEEKKKMIEWLFFVFVVKCSDCIT